MTRPRKAITEKKWPDETPEQLLARLDPTARAVVEKFMESDGPKRHETPKTIVGKKLRPGPAITDYTKPHKTVAVVNDESRENFEYLSRRSKADKLARGRAAAEGRRARAEARNRATVDMPKRDT